MKISFAAPEELNRFRSLALGIGVIGALAMLAGGYFNPEQGLRSYLIGFIFWCGISVGCLGVLILQYLTGGSWGVVIRRFVEAGSRSIPMAAILFAPLMLGVTVLYHWIEPGDDKILIKKSAYLNHLFWGARAILYFGLWSVMAYLLNKWSMQQDRTGDWTLLKKASRFCGPTMVIFALLVSFAAVDWVMSLDPHWFSTIFGLLYVLGWGLSCVAFVVALLAWMMDKEPMKHVLGPVHFHDLGKLMLAMVMVWAYFNLSQYLIIWSGNLPEETKYYLQRTTGGWGVVGILLIVFHFAFPFILLLSRDFKRNAKWLSLIAIFILVMRLVDLFFMIAPNPMGHDHAYPAFNVSWMDIVSPFAVGGLWLWWFFGELKSRPLMPTNDPFFEKAIAHGNSHH